MRVNAKRADAIFRGSVARICAEHRITRETFSKVSGMSLSHLRLCWRDPFALRVSDLRAIVEAYDLTDEEIVGIVKGDK